MKYDVESVKPIFKIIKDRYPNNKVSVKVFYEENVPVYEGHIDQYVMTLRCNIEEEFNAENIAEKIVEKYKAFLFDVKNN